MRGSGRYVLRGKEPVFEPDIEAWGRWFEQADRRVRQDVLPGGVQLSTVFIGLDHNFSPAGRPILFESLVFGGAHDGHMLRYSTWDEAERGHVMILKALEADNGDEGPDELDAFLQRKLA